MVVASIKRPMSGTALTAAEDWHPKLRRDGPSLRAMQQAEVAFERTVLRHLALYLRMLTQNFAVSGMILVQDEAEADRVSTLLLSSVDQQFDNKAFERDVQKAYARPLQLGAVMGANDIPEGMRAAESKTVAWKMPKLNVDWDILDEEAQEWLADQSSTLVTNVLETTRNRIRANLAAGFKSGESRDDIAKRLRNIEDDIPQWRARLIAQTEVITAHTAGALQVWDKNDLIQGKRWVDGQPKACPLCTVLNNKVIAKGEMFEGGIHGPPRHPGCRCTISASIVAPKAKQKKAPVPAPPAPAQPKGLPSTAIPSVDELRAVRNVASNPAWKAMTGGKDPDKIPASLYKDGNAQAIGAGIRKRAASDPDVDKQVKALVEKQNEVKASLGKPLRYSDPYVSFADNLISRWAGTSGDDDPMALAVQKVAAKEFNVPYGHLEEKDARVSADADARVGLYGKGIAAMLHSQYEVTQEMFAKANIKEVVMFRGQGLPVSPGTPETFRMEKVSLQPLSSFSVDRETSLNFSAGVLATNEAAVMIAMKVPVERILGSSVSGFGCIGEAELVVLGGNELPAKVVAGLGRGQAILN